jgi:hypothetical protein
MLIDLVRSGCRWLGEDARSYVLEVFFDVLASVGFFLELLAKP